MNYLNKPSFLKIISIPAVALIVWPIIFGLSLYFSEYAATDPNIFNWTLYVVGGLYILFILFNIIYLVSKKQYNYIAVFILGIILTAIILFVETIVIFGVGISGGATG